MSSKKPVGAITVYQCARCGYVAAQRSHYADHTARKKMCKLVHSDVIPDMNNVMRRSSDVPVVAMAMPAAAIMSTPVAAPALPAAINVTNNVNVTNIQINIDASNRGLMRFPHQDLSHLTRETKQRVLEQVQDAGFDAGVMSMIGMLYCDPRQPHNMNVIIQPPTGSMPEDEQPVTHVYGMDRRAPARWGTCDTAEALRLMLEEHGDAIRNFPDEVSEAPPQQLVDAVDAAFASQQYLQSTCLANALTDKVQATVGGIRATLRPYSHLLML